MGLFGDIIGTVIETVKLPVAVVVDAVTAFPDACEEEEVGRRTKEQLEAIKDAAKGDDD